MESLGPIAFIAEGASEELKQLESSSKHWICKGKRSISVAVKLIRDGKVVALRTDTVYGLACSALNNDAIKRLYEIKGRDEGKPLCISVSSVKYIKNWGVVDHLNPDLLTSLLPGPFTFVLKRQPDLNPNLNPVGPLALTSANVSNQPSCLEANEFKDLWPQLDGIFYDIEEHVYSEFSDENLNLLQIKPQCGNVVTNIKQ
nr:yrdC domain-containing protein, mitochondrial [Megalopta genalis]